MADLRRSARLRTEDSNGREYLANLLHLSRSQFEAWIASSTVQLHLQLWYRLCIANGRRYNDAVDWINTGLNGYFCNPGDLEEDLLLMCLGEGDAPCNNAEAVGYAVEDVSTGTWITQEIWARTVWRIVQSNKDDGQVFEEKYEEHPAWCYAAVVDLLCIAFHSIAHRGRWSCYDKLINGVTVQQLKTAMATETFVTPTAPDEDDAESFVSISIDESSTEASDGSSDSSFDEESSQTSISSEITTEAEMETKTEVKVASVESIGDKLVKRWVAEQLTLMEKGGLEDDAMVWAQTHNEADRAELEIVSEDGTPITGYRRAFKTDRGNV